MYTWSAKEPTSILKTIGGVICTIRVPFMQYYANKWLGSKSGIFSCINFQKVNSKYVHIYDTENSTLHLKKERYPRIVI